MQDILFTTQDYIFSYRVAGVLVKNGKVLLQKPTNDIGYAFSGGHVSFGETNEQTLIREFKEEIGADIKVNGLKWVGEIFFPWGDKPCHQICLYYDVDLQDETQIPLDRAFVGDEHLEGEDFKIEFHWIDIKNIDKYEIYPKNVVELMKQGDKGIQHFIYKEE